MSIKVKLSMADRIRLYLDEDAQRTTLVRALRACQVEALTAGEAGTIGMADDRINWRRQDPWDKS